MADRVVSVKLGADVSAFVTQMQRASGSVDDLAKKSDTAAKSSGSAMQRMAQSARTQGAEWSQVGGSITAVGAAWTGVNLAVAATGIAYNTLQQQSRAALTTLTGSAEAANKQMDALDDFARTSPFAKDVFIQAQQQMLGFGIEAERVIPFLSSINDAVAATGGSNQDIAELTRIFSQVQAAAKITATDLMQFGQRGVDAASLIGSQMGMTGAQIRDQITDGTLDATVALDALAAGMSDRFGGASANIKNTMVGAVDRVKAAFRDLSSSIMASAVGPEGGGWLVDLTNKAADLIRTIGALPEPVKQIGGALSFAGGAATLAAGGFFMLAPRLLESWDAMKRLGLVTPGVTNALGALGRAGGVAAAAALAIAIIGEGMSMLVDEKRGIEDIAAAVERLADASASIESLDAVFPERELLGLELGVDGLGEAFERLSYWNRDSFLNNANKQFVGLLETISSFESEGSQLRSVFEEIDQTLKGMDTEAAAASFAKIADAMRLEGAGNDEIAAIFDDYAAAVQGAASEHGGLVLSQAQLVAAMEGESVAVRNADGSWSSYGEHLPEVAAALDEAAIRQGEFTGNADQATAALQRLFPEFELSAGAALSASEAMIAATEAAADGATTLEQQEAALKAAGLEMVYFTDSTRLMTEGQAAWYSTVAESSGSFVSLLGAYDSVAGKAEEAARRVAESAAEKSKDTKDSWEDFYDGFEVSLTDYIAALGEQVAAQEQWQTNMLILSGRVSQGVLDHLAELGPEGAALVKDLTTASESELAVLEEAFGSAGRNAGNDFADNLAGAGPVLEAVAQTMGADAVAAVAAEIASGGATLQGIIDRYDLQATIDANADPAIRSAQAAMARIQAMRGTMTVDITRNVTTRNFGQAPVWTGGGIDHVAAAYGLAGGGAPPRRQPSGRVFGPGTTTSDSVVNVALSRDEFVHNAAARAYYGDAAMYAINDRRIPRDWFRAIGLADGGAPARTYQPSLSYSVAAAPAMGGGDTIHVTVAPGAFDNAFPGVKTAADFERIADDLPRLMAQKGRRR